MTNLDKSFEELHLVIDWTNYCREFFSYLISRKAQLERLNVQSVYVKLGARTINLYLTVDELEITLKVDDFVGRKWSVVVNDPKTGEWVYSPLATYSWWYTAFEEALEYINNRK